MAKDRTEDRREALCAWLTANGVDPDTVPLHGELAIREQADGSKAIAYEAYALAEDGHIQVDERRTGPALEMRTVPLVVDPPEWWEPYERPTRDQLLATVEELRTLIAAGPNTGTVVPGEYENGWDGAMEAVQRILDGKENR